MKVMFATLCYISAVSMNYVTSIFDLTWHLRSLLAQMHLAYAFRESHYACPATYFGSLEF